MGVFEFVLGVIIIGTVASLVRLKMGVRKDHWGNEHPVTDTAERTMLREEVRTLKDRIAVLERLATDEHGAKALTHEIERLR